MEITVFPLTSPTLFMIGWIIFWLFCYSAPLLGASSQPKKRNALPDDPLAKRQFYAIVFLATLMHTAGFFGFSLLHYEYSFFGGYVGLWSLVIFSGGVVLAMFGRWRIRFLSFRELACALSPEKNISGSYTFLKHPMYAGLTLAFLGFLLAYPTVVGTGSFTAIIVLFVWRARRE